VIRREREAVALVDRSSFNSIAPIVQGFRLEEISGLLDLPMRVSASDDQVQQLSMISVEIAV
jgi:hypothetical protein